MVYTDIELSILSQLAYQDMKEGDTLWSALISNQGYLEKRLGSDYKSHISGLVSKVKDNGCYIVKAQTNSSSGFSAFAVKDPINNNVVVACRGTELGKISENPVTAGKDLYEDVTLALSKETMQQKDMAEFMDDLQKGGYDEYSFTGHSLGGNLAMYGAITLKDKSKLKECKTFNAPGFNKDFHKQYESEIKSVKKRMTSYQNKYDGVSEALEVPGEKVILASKKKYIDGAVCHLQDDFVIEGGSFKKAKPQKKSVTALGLLLKYGGAAVGYVDENRENLGSISRFNTLPLSNSGGLTSFGGFGSSRIKLTPDELKGQASQMLALGNEFEQLFDGVVSDLNSVNRNWSANLANNFLGKITSAQGRFKHISDMLASGAAVANLSAINYETADSLLNKVISGELYIQAETGIVGILHNNEIIFDNKDGLSVGGSVNQAWDIAQNSIKDTFESISNANVTTHTGDSGTVHGGNGIRLESESNMNETENNDKLYTYGGQNYVSITNFSQYAMKQDLNIGNCTAVAWCMGRSMHTGEVCDPYSSIYWNPHSGAIYTGYGNVIGSNQFATMYDELSSGKPSMFYAYNGNSISGMHAVTVVGVSDGADVSNLSAGDFLCIDPTDGLTKRLSEVGYQNYNGTVYTYA